LPKEIRIRMLMNDYCVYVGYDDDDGDDDD
jgi:hypothetical protein